ncbi:MAG: HDIG domain-containing protein [Phycisphaerales bacterium]|nr:HDIG domain-containing protein [Phycisphaerales bacterium]
MTRSIAALKVRTKIKTDIRRQEAKRQRSAQRGRVWQRLSQSVSPYALLIWTGFYVSCLGLFLLGHETMPYRVGQRITQNITSRVDFQVENRDETEKRREEAREAAPNIYEPNPVPLETIRAELTHLLNLAKEANDNAEEFMTKAEAKHWSFEDPALAMKTLLEEYGNAEAGARKFESMIARVTDNLAAQRIVDQVIDELTRKRTPPNSILRRPGQPDVEVATTQLQTVKDSKIEQIIINAANQVVGEAYIPLALTDPVSALISRTLAKTTAGESHYTPLWKYDGGQTRKEMELAAQRQEPVVNRFQWGDVLVRAEPKTVLGNQNIELLLAENQHYLALQKTDTYLRREKLLQQIGWGVVFFVLTLGLVVYSVSYQPRVLRKPARTLALACLALLTIALSRLFRYPLNWPTELTVGLVVMAAAFLTIAYNQRFAFGVGGVLAAMVTVACQGTFGLFITHMTALGLTVFSLREVRTRSKIIAVGAVSALGTMIVCVCINLIDGQSPKYVLSHGLAAGGAALGAGFLVQGLLPTFEKIFGIATSMTLLEWCDASRPLLRRLAQEAPGTYSHSLILSQMVEEAAESIGARGLLARVGAIYHDIGKIQKPGYFVENQEARISRHDRLSPTMSLLVIVGHVKDGVELARAYGLPRILHQFILEHHGTTVVRYFHYLASEAAARNSKIKGKHDREVAESEFRYAGPKPGSKEAAILMICDGCEGAVRAINEPTPGRIESTVHQVVMERLTDGQFDDCDITMRELSLVEQSLVKSLCAVHHGRIKYPKKGADKEKALDPAPTTEDADTVRPSAAGQAAQEVAPQS